MKRFETDAEIMARMIPISGGKAERESSSQGKEQTERSSQQNDIDSMLDDQLGLTDDEKALDADREGLDVRAERTAELQDRRSGDRAEPEVVVKKDDVEDPLQKALKTIESLQTRQADLERRLSEPRATETRQEPQVEMVEILPNLRLPKDRGRWPIRITDEDLVRMGWNENTKGPAEVLNILGNALFQFVVETVPELATRNFDARLNAREGARRTTDEFESLHPHLKEHKDIVGLVETNLRQRGNASPLYNKFGKDYYDELARHAEAKLANIRGITVEQYRAEVASRRRTTSSSGGTTSRARSAGGGTRSSSPQNRQSDFERDSSDL